MADSNAHVSASSAEPRRLPSPGCLFVVTLLVIVAAVGGWIGRRVQRQQARLAYFQELGRNPETEPAKPVWMHDFVASTFGKEHAAGFTDSTLSRQRPRD